MDQYCTSNENIVIFFLFFMRDENGSPHLEKGVKGGNFNFICRNFYFVAYN